MALLIAPLAAVPGAVTLAEGIGNVLAGLTLADAAAVYRAIRVATPGGLGSASEQDIAGEPTVSLLDAMRLAADRDRIARQYVSDFADVLDFGCERLRHWRQRTDDDWEAAVIGLQLEFLAAFPDSLIGRKCGDAVAWEASRRAAAVLAADWPHAADVHVALQQFDHWLRADGHRRNPGTTADLVAATLFATLRDEIACNP